MPDRMRTVLHISREPYWYFGDDHRGGAAHPPVRHAVQQFVKRGWRTVYVYSSSIKKPRSSTEGVELIPVYFPFQILPMSRPVNWWDRQVLRAYPPAYVLWFWFTVRRLCREIQPDLIYAHDTHPSIVGTYISRARGIPTGEQIVRNWRCAVSPEGSTLWYSPILLELVDSVAAEGESRPLRHHERRNKGLGGGASVWHSGSHSGVAQRR